MIGDRMGIGCPWTGVMGGWKPPNMGMGGWQQE